jgi:capsular polysaccharide biosynthesis protein
VSSDPGANQHDALRDEAIDTGRYVSVLRRNALLVVAIVALWTCGTWAASFLLPPTYESSGQVIVVGRQGDTSGTLSPETINRELANLQSAVTTSSVLQRAADQLGVDARDLGQRVTASVDGVTSILTVTAHAGTAEGAQNSADTVIDVFLQHRRESTRARLEASIESISTEIIALESSRTIEGPQREALTERRAELIVAAATAGDDVQLAQEAGLPSEPTSPRPLRNAVIAFFVSLAIAVVLVLGLDQVNDRRRLKRRGWSNGSPNGVSAPAGAGAPPASGLRHRQP